MHIVFLRIQTSPNKASLGPAGSSERMHVVSLRIQTSPNKALLGPGGSSARMHVVCLRIQTSPNKASLGPGGSSARMHEAVTRPPQLPTAITAIAMCVVHSPPDRKAQEQNYPVITRDYPVFSTNSVRSRYPDCGIVILGGSNQLNINEIISFHDLTQRNTRPTRGDAFFTLS